MVMTPSFTPKTSSAVAVLSAWTWKVQPVKSLPLKSFVSRSPQERKQKKPRINRAARFRFMVILHWFSIQNYGFFF